MKKFNDRMLLESLVRKYGKNSVKGVIRKIYENVNDDFEIKDGVLVKYHGNDRKVIIPDSVTSIGEYAFSCCESLTSIIIPDSVTSIEKLSFYGCTSLTSVIIPDSITEIGYAAFASCTSLTNVTIPDSVTTIGKYAFDRCKSLTSVTIPDSVTSIEDGAFRDCTSLTSVTILNSATTIGKYAFSFCESLTNVTIPDGVKIGKYAFKGTKIKIENKSLISDNINDIVNAAINVFTDWENDEEGWDRPFNAYKELSNNDFTDILDYYNGWYDFYNYLDMDEYEFTKFYHGLSDRYLKKINKEIQSAF